MKRTITIDLRILAILLIGILLIGIGTSVIAQSVSLVTYTYRPNGSTNTFQYADTNAPAVHTVAAGQAVTLYQPYQMNDMLWWASITPNHDEWIIFASVGNCDQIPFGTLSK